MFVQQRKPSDISMPGDITITPPAPHIPDNVKRFFGKTGMWWGSWKSHQTRDGFETILIIKNIDTNTNAAVEYIVPDYPPWYVTGGRHATPARFFKKESGRVSLLFPFDPFGYTMECWFEGHTLRGAVHMRFMSASIELIPLNP